MRLTAGMIGLAAGIVAAGLTARGADVEADLPVLSAYVWRGQVLNDETVVQPALNIESGGFGLNVWGNYNTTDNVGDRDFNEIDLTVSYGLQLGPVELGGGVIEYLFPNTDYESTREVYLSASLPDAPVVPCLSVYRDVEEADGFYATLGLSKEYAFNEEKTTLGLSASLGGGDQDYNDFYFGVKDDALNDVTVGASLAHAFTDAVTLTPGVLYSSLVDSDIRDGARELYGKSDELVGSLTLTVTF
jgi:hypothetical protein